MDDIIFKIYSQKRKVPYSLKGGQKRKAPPILKILLEIMSLYNPLL
jgi:hypothetical protein